MNYLYLWLALGSLSIPFLFSFHPRLRFYRKWRSFFPAMAIMMAIFVTWDIIFTNNGFWGFNDAYITGYRILNLPIEEWLFFICIPYACIFTHYALHELFPKFSFSEKFTAVFYVLLSCLLIILLWYYYDRWYTLVNFVYALVLLGLVYNYRKQWLMEFLPTYFVIFIPFFLVNGILTGTGIEDQVVWYDNTENMGVRILTIPVEDTIYNLGMLLTVFVGTELFEKRYNNK
ncbi:lycopene cyclase domain-containing protein [Marixanthomonas spongiae]|uniref:Lycopene cyclase domain-containing protein n=1 Tax=Marixanthomonas spongiae TaxID=2174845 RepID=A0A2U0I453_9FLAO|nr:lycopene cyclase domain-containing protein [Marixanthomonas spongiae]PVW15893.1 lycopene cyclase domain-containing protein [Marixanthomonas spongiae]